VSHYCDYRRGDPITIVSGRYHGCTELVDSAVVQRTVDYPKEYAPGYHVVLDDGTVVTVLAVKRQVGDLGEAPDPKPGSRRRR